MKETTIVVWVTAQFVGFHRWRNAPESTAFLRSWHRHVFHVKLGVRVKGSDREVEFFALKKDLTKHLGKWEGQQFEYSCEMIAGELFEAFEKGCNVAFVEVSEDGENGGVVSKE